MPLDAVHGASPSGHHLLFWSASVGLVLLACARGVELLLSDVVQWWPNVLEQWQRVAPFPYVGTTALAFLLGPCGAFVINWFHSESSGAMRAVHSAGNDFRVVIPVAEVRSARPFAFETYFQFQDGGLVD